MQIIAGEYQLLKEGCRKLSLAFITDQIKAHQHSSVSPASPEGSAASPEASAGHQHHTYTILCTPRITALCRRVLEDLGVIGDVELREYRLEWIGLEDDLLSLELENVAKDIYMVSIRTASADKRPTSFTCRTATIHRYIMLAWR